MSDTTASQPAGEEERPNRPRRAFARLRDRIVASDPAFSRLRLASRALISVIVTGCLLAAITLLHKLPIAAYGIGIIMSFTGSTAVRDKTAQAQLVTRLLAAMAATSAVLVASVLAPARAIADLAFLIVIFTAVYIRKFGQRGFAVGMLTFMAYFMGDYLHPQPQQMGWVALAAFLGLGVTHGVTTFLLVDDPERDFRRALTTIDRRINLILRELRRAASAGSLDKENRKELNAHIARLHDIVLMAEGFIPQGDDGGLAARGAASDLAVALFDLQLGIERLVAASLKALPPAPLVDAVLHGDMPTMRRAAAALDDQPESNALATQQVLLRLRAARRRLEEALGPSPALAFRTKAPATDTKGPDRMPPAPPEGTKKPPLIPESLHLPIQVTLASAVAMTAGLFLSSTRWYWAVITAFIVFNNTRSRADAAVRALQRSAGTLGGLVAGTIVATLMRGDMAGSLILMLALFFVAIYYVQTSYGVMIFFLTIAIALLYGLMGVFTPELLVLRLEETLIGAACGVSVAFFVFPKRATTGVAEALEVYLSALHALVDAARTEAHAPERDRQTARDLLALSRALDRSFADLSTAARPLGGFWTVVTRFG
ncbi:MAG: FUSC family protein, partial [Pararhizobium sp.]